MQDQHDAMATGRRGQGNRRMTQQRRGAVAQRVFSLFGFWALLAQIAPLAAVAQSQGLSQVADEGINAISLAQLAESIGQAASLSAYVQGAKSTSITRTSTPGFGDVAPMGSEATDKTSYGLDSVAVGTASTALGYGAHAGGHHSAALGHKASASGSNSTALGHFAHANGTHSSALGHKANSSGYISTALGYHTNASGYGATALGAAANASAYGSLALSAAARASGEYSLALGVDANASGFGSSAMGSGLPPVSALVAGFVISSNGETGSKSDGTFELVFASEDGFGLSCGLVAASAVASLSVLFIGDWLASESGLADPVSPPVCEICELVSSDVCEVSTTSV